MVVSRRLVVVFVVAVVLLERGTLREDETEGEAETESRVITAAVLATAGCGSTGAGECRVNEGRSKKNSQKHV